MTASWKTRRCILVLGMHRSGTSAATRMINILGADLPKNLMPPGAGNEKGHWEQQRLVDLNEEILAELDSRWADCRSLDLSRLKGERRSYYQAQIAQIIADEYVESPIFVVKDPRICRLMPL